MKPNTAYSFREIMILQNLVASVSQWEREIIAVIQQLWRDGLSYRAIVKKLNADGIPMKQDAHWQMNTARQIFYAV